MLYWYRTSCGRLAQLGEHRVRNAGVGGSNPPPSTISRPLSFNLILVPDPLTLTREEQLARMRSDWDARARDNAHYYVASGRPDWTDAEFFASGDQVIADDIRTDLGNICQSKSPASMRILEIGCGVGRLTRALADVFGEVHAVDVSGEMIRRARVNLADRPQAHVYQNNGCDLAVLPALAFDFAYSNIVFQHIPSRDVIESYVREVHRVLSPGALFKFQVQGHPIATQPDDTWNGVSYSEQEACAMAERCGFEPRYRHGVGTQYFWLWFFKNT
jgi:SAM-dependent methyltransferase